MLRKKISSPEVPNADLDYFTPETLKILGHDSVRPETDSEREFVMYGEKLQGLNLLEGINQLTQTPISYSGYNTDQEESEELNILDDIAARENAAQNASSDSEDDANYFSFNEELEEISMDDTPPPVPYRSKHRSLQNLHAHSQHSLGERTKEISFSDPIKRFKEETNSIVKSNDSIVVTLLDATNKMPTPPLRKQQPSSSFLNHHLNWANHSTSSLGNQKTVEAERTRQCYSDPTKRFR